MARAADDYVCTDCAAELGPTRRPEEQARRARARTLRHCEDCGLPMEEDAPICGYCHWQRTRSENG